MNIHFGYTTTLADGDTTDIVLDLEDVSDEFFVPLIEAAVKSAASLLGLDEVDEPVATGESVEAPVSVEDRLEEIYQHMVRTRETPASYPLPSDKDALESLREKLNGFYTDAAEVDALRQRVLGSDGDDNA